MRKKRADRRPAGARRTGSERLPALYGYAALLVAAIVAYWPALNGGMVWDDDGHLTKTALQSVHGLWRIWFDLGATQQYYPLLHSAFWLEHRLWGDSMLGYHLVNVVLHALSACLVVAIVRRLELAGAWLAGFVFLLHPVCVESVAWISEQKNAMSVALALGAALAYLSFDRSRARSQYALATVLFVLSLLAKTVTATLPAALLVIFWWKRGRLDSKRDVLPLAPWLAIGAGAGLFTSWVEKTFIGAQGADFALTFGERALVASRAICFYALKAIWPANLMFTYPHWRIDTSDWREYLYPVAVLGVAGALLMLARKRRGPLAAFLIFAGTLFPVLGFLNVYPFRYSYVADHFQYFSMLALIVPAAAAVQPWMRREPYRIAAVVVVLVLAGLSWRQAGTYADAETLYRDALSKNPESWMAHNGLGNVLVQSGRIEDSIAEYDAAIRLRPGVAEPHLSRGLALSRWDPPRGEEAIAEYRKALEIKPGWAEAHVNLGNALLKAGSQVEAIDEYQAALRLKPDLAEAHNGLGNVLARNERFGAAVDQYQAALRINPDYLEARVNLGTTYARMGRTTDAIAEYRSALEIRPDLDRVRKVLEELVASQP